MNEFGKRINGGRKTNGKFYKHGNENRNLKKRKIIKIGIE